MERQSLCVHSSRAHAYFSVIWVSVYFSLLCGLVETGIHKFCALQNLKGSQNNMLETCVKRLSKRPEMRMFMENLNE